MQKAKQNARSPSNIKKVALRRMFFAGFHVGKKSKTKRKCAGKACAKKGKKVKVRIKRSPCNFPYPRAIRDRGLHEACRSYVENSVYCEDFRRRVPKSEWNKQINYLERKCRIDPNFRYRVEYSTGKKGNVSPERYVKNRYERRDYF